MSGTATARDNTMNALGHFPTSGRRVTLTLTLQECLILQDALEDGMPPNRMAAAPYEALRRKLFEHTGYFNLASFLHESRLTQKKFANRVGISASYLSMILAGQRTPPLDLALRIASEANVPVESLMPPSSQGATQ